MTVQAVHHLAGRQLCRIGLVDSMLIMSCHDREQVCSCSQEDQLHPDYISKSVARCSGVVIIPF